MKISVSLIDEDVAFLDDYARIHGMRSRSAAVHQAIRLLRASELADDYAAAFEEWINRGESDVWEATAPDGLFTV